VKRLTIVLIAIAALVYASLGIASERRDGWQLLGQKEAARTHDRDEMDVPRKAGPFRQLRLAVRGAPVELDDVIVTFGDGQKFRPRVPRRLPEGDAYIIELPGRRRSVDRVALVYHSYDRRQQTAKVFLYGR
jgi:hypothetical protein